MGTLTPGVPYTDPTPDQVTDQVNGDRAAAPRPTARYAHGDVLDDYNFAAMQPGRIPANATDVATLPGQHQDRLSIIPGGLGHIVGDLEGDDYTKPGGDLINGQRGCFFRDYQTYNMRVRCYIDLTETPGQGGGPLVCVNPFASRLGISGWNNGFFIELGYVAILPLLFEYADQCWLSPAVLATLTPVDLTQSIQDLIVCNGWVWQEVNGHRVAGPIRVPDDLVSTLAGAQTDVQGSPTWADPVPPRSALRRMVVTAYNGPIPAQYPAPTFIKGAFVETTGTSVAVPVPAGLVAGDVAVVAVGGSVTVTAPTGFTLVSQPSTTGVACRVYRRVIVGDESWLAGPTMPVTTSNGTSTACMVGVRATTPAFPIMANTSTDITADTATTLAASASWAGPHRASLGFVATAVSGAQTWPAGWTKTGGNLLSMGTVADWSTPGGSLSTVQGTGPGLLSSVPAQAVTCPSGRAVSVHLVLNPDPIGAPT